jgi:type II secretory pathway pseudopilin PulG
MKRRSSHGFTLIEMITVVAIIIVLVGLVISTYGFINNKAARTRAYTEIQAIGGACNAYNIDNGTYPKSDDTNALDPRVAVSPTSSAYLKSSLYLYSCLTGDFLPAGSPDGKPESANKTYFTFTPQQLSYIKDPTGGIGTVRAIQDPFGNAYGYSTAANDLEATYREAVRKDPTATRPTNLVGYNPTFDLWSTAGQTTATNQVKWVKNWGE